MTKGQEMNYDYFTVYGLFSGLVWLPDPSRQPISLWRLSHLIRLVKKNGYVIGCEAFVVILPVQRLCK